MSRFSKCSRALRAGVVLVAVALSVLLCSVSASAAPTPGVAPDLTWGISRSDMDREIAMLKQLRVQSVRLDMNWNSLEPATKGAYNTGFFSDMDYAVARSRAAGLQVILQVGSQIPYWASADPAKSIGAGGVKRWNNHWKPTRFSDYADFAAYIANRYKGYGVHLYEIYNEPNLRQFWPSGPSPAEYTAMLRAAYPAVHRADPQATVLTGGLSDNDSGFLQGMYSAGARAYFDAVADHTYPARDPLSCWTEANGKKSRYALCGVEEIRKTMTANGDAAKSVYITEFGFSTWTGTNGWTERQQATNLSNAFLKLATYPWIATAQWYNVRNNYWQRNDSSNWDANLGLLRTDWTPKPAYTAYYNYTHRATTTSGTTRGTGDGATTPTGGGATTPTGASTTTPTGASTTTPTSASATTPASGGGATTTSTTTTSTGNATTTRAKSKKSTSTRLTVSSSGTAASSGQRFLTTRRPILRGRIKGVRTGSVTVRLMRRDPSTGGWRTVKKLKTRVSADGSFFRRLDGPLSPGRWRARASYAGSSTAKESKSRYVYFRVSRAAR